MQIIENRFKRTNIYRLLASEKDSAESQRVISIGGLSFEQGEREGKEGEYRMGPFFKAWAAYCGILTKLPPTGLQGDLACALYIYTMNLHDLLERYTWEGVQSCHFQFHRKRIASGKEVFYPENWRKIDAELIASKYLLFPTPNISRDWGSARGRSDGRGQQLPIAAHNQQLSIAMAGHAKNPSDTIPPPDSHSACGALILQSGHMPELDLPGMPNAALLHPALVLAAEGITGQRSALVGPVFVWSPLVSPLLFHGFFFLIQFGLAPLACM